MQESHQEIEEVQGERAQLEAQQVRLIEEMKATDILTQKLKVGDGACCLAVVLLSSPKCCRWSARS